MYKRLFIILCMLLAVSALYSARGTVGLTYQVEKTDFESRQDDGPRVDFEGQDMLFNLYVGTYFGSGHLGYGVEAELGGAFPFDPDVDGFFINDFWCISFRVGFCLRYDFTDMFAISVGVGLDHRYREKHIKFENPYVWGGLMSGVIEYDEFGVYGRAMAEFTFNAFRIGLGVIVSSPYSFSVNYPIDYVISDDIDETVKGVRIAPSLILAWGT